MFRSQALIGLQSASQNKNQNAKNSAAGNPVAVFGEHGRPKRGARETSALDCERVTYSDIVHCDIAYCDLINAQEQVL